MKKISLILFCLILLIGCSSLEGKKKIYYHNDFSKMNKDFNSYESGAYSEVLDGKYVIKNTNGGTYTARIPIAVLPRTNEDFEVVVNLSSDSGADNYPYGVIFGMETDQKLHMFRIAEKGYYRYDRVNKGKRIDGIDWKRTGAINSGMRNELKIKRFGDKLQLYINDCIVEEVDALPNYYGNIGFVVSGGMMVEIYDITIFGYGKEL